MKVGGGRLGVIAVRQLRRRPLVASAVPVRSWCWLMEPISSPAYEWELQRLQRNTDSNRQRVVVVQLINERWALGISLVVCSK